MKNRKNLQQLIEKETEMITRKYERFFPKRFYQWSEYGFWLTEIEKSLLKIAKETAEVGKDIDIDRETPDIDDISKDPRIAWRQGFELAEYIFSQQQQQRLKEFLEK